MIKDIKTRNKILGGIGIAAIIALLIAIPAVGRSSKHNDVAANDTEITSDALQKESDIDSHQYPTSSADLESQSSEELTTANTLENSSETDGETVDTTNVASNTVESEQSNQNVDTSNNIDVSNNDSVDNSNDTVPQLMINSNKFHIRYCCQQSELCCTVRQDIPQAECRLCTDLRTDNR